MSLTREEILNFDDLKTETVKIPEWGGEVIVREMTGKQRGLFEEYVGDDDVSGVQVVAEMIALSCVSDDNVSPLFTRDDVEALAGKSMPALMWVFAACQRINGLDQASIDDAVKNSEATTEGGSCSG